MRLTVLVLVCCAGFLPAQMEKRLRGLYDREAFRSRMPAVGKPVGDLKLRDLEGKKVSLAAMKGKALVLLGGAYT